MIQRHDYAKGQNPGLVKEIHAKCPQTHIYVQGVLPINSTSNNFPQHYDKEEHMRALNKLLQANAAVGNYIYVDIFHLSPMQTAG